MLKFFVKLAAICAGAIAVLAALAYFDKSTAQECVEIYDDDDVEF